MERKDYYIGLDIGTNSVGWAVVDEEYRLCRFKKYDMWGTRLFDEAKPAAERRGYRAGRRRNQRKKQRIDLLQEIFAEEMAKVDKTFFLRLNESRLHPVDKSTDFKHPLFNDKGYTDREYYDDYPTIFHLRKELMESTEPHDIRLVYLALHHILKNRGHFLIDGSLEEAKEFSPAFSQLCETLKDALQIQPDHPDVDKVKAVLIDKKIKKSEKTKQLKALLSIDPGEKTKEEQKKQEKQIEIVCRFLAGGKGDFKKLAGDEYPEESDLKSFTMDSMAAEEAFDQIEKEASQFCMLFESIKAVFDWKLMTEILGEAPSFSDAKVGEYDLHHENLKLLRRFVLRYCDKKTYNAFFNDPKGGYSRYIGALKKNGKKYYTAASTPEDFYKELKNLLAGMKDKLDAEDGDDYAKLVFGAEEGTLLPLLRSKSNSTIPHQIHLKELDLILKNAEKYLPFLSEADEDGLTAAQKIRSVFTFRIPYYVGPLSLRHKDLGAHVWIERKEEGKIYPWNFEQKVDSEKSNEAFIERLTNQCTYMKDQTVLPKRSLLYSEFMVLNELNNLKIHGRRIDDVDLKQRIFRDLFLEKNRVTGKKLLEYLQREEDSELRAENISGLSAEDNGFNTSMASFLDFKKKVFGGKMESAEDRAVAEEIIRWITIYDDDKKMIRKAITSAYPGYFSEEQLKAITKLKFSGWGNLSKAFLCDLRGADKETGEVYSVIEALRETNCNLMELLSSRFTFAEELEKYNAALRTDIEHVNYESLVEGLYVSPACKRSIWQTVRITEEIKKIMGCEPKKIFVEMTRGSDGSGRKKSRKQQLLDLYANCEEDVRDWIKEIEEKEERDFGSRKLFLYYLQQGRCMYSGEVIDLDELMSKNSRWDKDHIYPQSKVKDDSLDNLVLSKKKKNLEKGDRPIPKEWQQKMAGFWRSLLNKGFISKEKYARLTAVHEKDVFRDDEMDGFIRRQLVETGQSSKAVAELLQELYQHSRVVYVKAGLVSHFRQNDLGVLKSRRVNDYHHAKDAYLNVVVGDVYDRKFTADPVRWRKKNPGKSYNLDNVFLFDAYDNGKLFWHGVDFYRDEEGKMRLDKKDDLIHGGTIDTVRAIAKQNTNIRYTEYSYCETGQLYNLTICPKSDTSITIPLKKDLPPERYGGYKSASSSYFALIEFDDKKGDRSRQIIGVPIHMANKLSYDPDAFKVYCETSCGMQNVRIVKDRIKKNALISVNGYPMRLRGENDNNNQLKNNLQLILSESGEETLRRVEKYLDKKASFEPVPEKDGFDREVLAALYDELTEKFFGAYAKRPANKGAFLREKRDVFVDLEKMSDMAKVLNEIVTMLRTDAKTTADLKTIGGSTSLGNIACNKTTLGGSRLVLIHQSVTGLFEMREEL